MLAKLKRHTGAFFRWWVSELVALLPPSVVSRLHLARPRLLVTVDDAGMDIALDGLEGCQSLGAFAWGETLPAEVMQAASDADIVVGLPDSEVLVNDIVLPAAAQENLRGVVGYEMDRHTPFTADQVHFGCRRLRSATPSGGIPVRLAVVLHSRMSELTSHLAAAGLTPTRVQPQSDSEIDLTPMAATGGASWRPSVQGLLGTVATVLLLTAVALPLWELERAATTLREEATDLAASAERAQSLRETRDRLLTQAQSVADLRAKQPTVLETIEELASLLPDDTWIWSFQLRGDEVVIRGLTPSASGLIERIEQSSLFQGVSFSAPITREADGERFQIAMQLVEGQA